MLNDEKKDVSLIGRDFSGFRKNLVDFAKQYYPNTYNDFNNQEPLSWHDSYIDPYDPDMTYYKWLSDQGFQSNQSYHFRADAHRKWAEFLLPYLTKLL